MGKARLLRQLPETAAGAEQMLWHMTPPLNGYEHVVSSAVYVGGRPETYLFGADPNGLIVDWLELPGSFRDDLDHDRAIREAGYTVAHAMAQSPEGSAP